MVSVFIKHRTNLTRCTVFKIPNSWPLTCSNTCNCRKDTFSPDVKYFWSQIMTAEYHNSHNPGRLSMTFSCVSGTAVYYLTTVKNITDNYITSLTVV